MSNECENVIARTGWGPCHYFIVGLCSMCAFAEACASPIILIVVPLLACDLKLSTSQANTVHATLTFGMAAGSFIFGIIIDANGRKGSIPGTMIIVFCASISLSFAQTTFFVNLSIFMLGLGLAGNNVVLRVYLIELLPMRKRGMCLAVLDVSGIMGYVSALGISWLFMPSIIRLQHKRFRLNSWRVLTGLGGIPNLIMACIVSLLPASPRYLLYRRRQEEALAVLQQIYAINTSKHANTYAVSNLDNCVWPDEEDEDDASSVVRTMRKFCVKTCKRIRELCKTPLKRVTMLGICTSFLQFPGIAWFALWNTRMLQEMEKFDEPIRKYSACTIDMQTMALEFLYNCEEVNADRLRLLLCLSTIYVFAEIVLLVGIDIIGRRIFLVFAGLMGATASLVLLFAVHSSVRITLILIILATYAISRTTTTILLLENYSTGLRGTIIGLTRILPYFVASFAKFFLNINCFSSIIFVSGFLLSTAVAGVRIPDLTRSPMRE